MAGTPLDQFCKLDHHVSNHINPFLSVKLWLFLLVVYLKPNRLEAYTTSRQPEIGEFWSITGALHITTQRTATRAFTLNFLLAISQCVQWPINRRACRSAAILQIALNGFQEFIILHFILESLLRSRSDFFVKTKIVRHLTYSRNIL